MGTCFRMRRSGLAGGLALAALLAPATAWAGRSTYAPYPGATFIYDDSVEQKVHILKIDLTNKKIRIRITSRDDALKPDGSKRPMGPHQFAKRRHLQMATNGSIGGDHAGADMHVNGLVKGYGEMWPLQSEGLNAYMKGDVQECTAGSTALCSHAGLVAISADNQDILLHTVTELSFPNDIVPDTYDVAAGGRPVIVWDGQVVDNVPPYASEENLCAPSACSREPRTAYGFDQDKKTLFLAVVDGREHLGGSGKGMATHKLGKKLQQNGAWWAYNLDGGGSSAMFIQGWWNLEGRTNYPDGIVNVPSDGSVRTVPLQIGVQVVEPRGHLEGTVRKGDAAAGAPLAGVTVTVTYVDDAGATKTKSDVTDATGDYSITDIDAGRQSVSVTGAGKKTWTRQKLIAAGDVNRLDVGLAAVSATADGTAIDGQAEPALDLEDLAGPDTIRRCFVPIPPDQLEATDQDLDFPSGGSSECPTESDGDAGPTTDAGATTEPPRDAGTTPPGATPDATPNPAADDATEPSNGCACSFAATERGGAWPIWVLLALVLRARRRARGVRRFGRVHGAGLPRVGAESTRDMANVL